MSAVLAYIYSVTFRYSYLNTIKTSMSINLVIGAKYLSMALIISWQVVIQSLMFVTLLVTTKKGGAY